MEWITLRFAASNTITSKVIRFATWSDYSHVDYVFTPNLFFGALPKTGVDFHNTKFDHTLFLQMQVNNKKQIEEALLKEIHKPYDWKAISAIPIRAKWNSKNKWFCSELIAHCISQDTHLFNERFTRITPRDLLINPLIRPV